MNLTDIIDRFRGPLVGLIISWGATPTDAMEIAQDSFADAYLGRETCRGDWQDPLVFGPWLRGIARNHFRSQLRSQRRREQRVMSVAPDVLEATAQQSPPVNDERLERLRIAIEQLPTQQRRVVMMHYLEETSVNEVAAILSVTPKTVEGRLYQARRTLKQIMGQKSSFWNTKVLSL